MIRTRFCDVAVISGQIVYETAYYITPRELGHQVPHQLNCGSLPRLPFSKARKGLGLSYENLMKAKK